MPSTESSTSSHDRVCERLSMKLFCTDGSTSSGAHAWKKASDPSALSAEAVGR